jgi:predicted RNase H-like nuclease (RuvC/YqgF family)
MAIAGLAGAMLLFALYAMVRDRETGRKMAMMEAGIDALNKEHYNLARSLERFKLDTNERLDALEHRESNDTDAEALHFKLDALLRRVQQLEEDCADGHTPESDIHARLEQIEGRLRELAFATDHGTPDAKRILQLHAQGLDSAAIAKQLRMGQGEVELILKFSKIRD